MDIDALLAPVKRPWASTVNVETVLAAPYEPAATVVFARSRVTAPEVPPPLRPTPAVTDSMSPASLVKLMTPVVEL